MSITDKIANKVVGMETRKTFSPLPNKADTEGQWVKIPFALLEEHAEKYVTKNGDNKGKTAVSYNPYGGYKTTFFLPGGMPCTVKVEVYTSAAQYEDFEKKANAPDSEDLLDEDTIEEPKVTRKAFVTVDGAKKEIPAFNYGGTFPSPATIAEMVDTRGEDEDAAKFTSALVKHIKTHAKVEKVTTDIAKSYKFKQGRPPKA